MCYTGCNYILRIQYEIKNQTINLFFSIELLAPLERKDFSSTWGRKRKRLTAQEVLAEKNRPIVTKAFGNLSTLVYHSLRLLDAKQG